MAKAENSLQVPEKDMKNDEEDTDEDDEETTKAGYVQ